MRDRLLIVALAGALSLTACGSETDESTAAGDSATVESAAPSSTPSASKSASESASAAQSASPAEVVVEVRIRDGEVDPAGDRIQARVGEPVTFVIDSDVPGELHVHSTPEHSIEIEPGTTEQSITIDQPGVVEAELHDPPLVVVQLEVR